MEKPFAINSQFAQQWNIKMDNKQKAKKCSEINISFDLIVSFRPKIPFEWMSFEFFSLDSIAYVIINVLYACQTLQYQDSRQR